MARTSAVRFTEFEDGWRKLSDSRDPEGRDWSIFFRANTKGGVDWNVLPKVVAERAARPLTAFHRAILSAVVETAGVDGWAEFETVVSATVQAAGGSVLRPFSVRRSIKRMVGNALLEEVNGRLRNPADWDLV